MLEGGYRIQEVAKLYGVSVNTVRSWFAMGLKTVKLGRVRIILKEDLDGFMHQRRGGSDDPHEAAGKYYKQSA